MVQATDILGIMKEVGIKEGIINAIKTNEPLHKQGIDSIDFPIIAAAAEKRFGINLSNARSSEIKSIDDFVNFINSKK